MGELIKLKPWLFKKFRGFFLEGHAADSDHMFTSAYIPIKDSENLLRIEGKFCAAVVEDEEADGIIIFELHSASYYLPHEDDDELNTAKSPTEED